MLFLINLQLTSPDLVPSLDADVRGWGAGLDGVNEDANSVAPDQPDPQHPGPVENWPEQPRRAPDITGHYYKRSYQVIGHTYLSWLNFEKSSSLLPGLR